MRETPKIGKRELNEGMRVYLNYREEHGITELASIKRFSDESGFLFCNLCCNEECKHVYDFSDYHKYGFYALCGECLKRVMFRSSHPDEASTALSPANLRTRFLVLERDGFRCVYCGRSPKNDDSVILHVDHVHPRSKGGSDDMSNLVACCVECNLGKGDYILKNRR